MDVRHTFPILLALVLAPNISMGASEDCQEEANQLVRNVINSVAVGDHFDPLEPDLRRLKKLWEQKCFNPRTTTQSPLSSKSYTHVYFDLGTMEPTDLVKKARERNWDILQKRLQLTAISGNEQDYRSLRENLDRKYEEIKPEGIRSPSQITPQPLSENEKSRMCQPLKTDIKKKLPPVRNQGGSGWCFFYTSADLLSYKLGEDISASYLGAMLSPKGSGGSGADSINRLIKDQGLCLEKTMPSNELPHRSDSYSEWAEEFERKATEFSNGQGDAICKLHSEAQVLFPSAGLDDILDVVRRTTEGDKIKATGAVEVIGNMYESPISPSYLSHIAKDQCKGDRERLSEVAQLVEVNTDSDPTMAFEEINKLLDRGQPAGISYNYYQILGGKGGGHVSSVVDRRFINGRCQFLVRNSWGTSSCSQMVSEKDGCEPPGHFWVNAVDLTSSIRRVIYAK